MDESESPVNSDPAAQKKYKLMLSLWLSFCIVGFIWFVTKVLKGRQRIRYNFSSIEEQLKKMQAMMEERDKEAEENGITEGESEKDTPDPTATDTKDDIVDENDDKEVLSNGAIGNASELDDDNESEEVNMSRRRKTMIVDDDEQQLMDQDSVDLIRDTIEDIINDGVKEVSEESNKKDN